MVQSLMRYLAAGAIALLIMSGSLAAGGVASAAAHAQRSATASVTAQHISARFAPAATGNYCNLPTSAGAGSGYWSSESDCLACVADASSATAGEMSGYRVWYCTWNASRNAADLHFSANDSGTCDLPQAAGPGSGYLKSENCLSCVNEAAFDVVDLPTSHLVYYCTWNSSRGLADLHFGD